MQLHQKILTFLLFSLTFLGVFSNSKAQEIDTMAVFRIENSYPLNITRSAMSFDVYMQRTSERWNKFANATLMLGFNDPNFTFSAQDLTLGYFDDTNLELPMFPGQIDIPDRGYLIEPKMFDDRISITVLGPPGFNSAQFIPFETDVFVGRFEVATVSGEPLPEKITWKRPYDYYQAAAFKIDRDSLYDEFITLYNPNDNLEMMTGRNSYVHFEDAGDEPEYVFDSLHVEYVGNLDMDIHWASRVEIGCRGYTLIRGVKPDRDSEEMLYIDTVATWIEGDKKFNAINVGKGNSLEGHFYGVLRDIVEFRGGSYCYELYGNIWNKESQEWEDVFLDRECEEVPHAVIAWAQANPNPFRERTTIEFEVEDDVYLELSVFDLVGKHLGYLTDNATGKTYNGEKSESSVARVGTHTAKFEPSEVVAQGMYTVLLVAYPINDPSVEISKALVKAYLQREGSQ